MSTADIIKLIVSIIACEGAGALGAVFTTPAIPRWYKTLKKPSFTPPNRAFGPVWITLYLLMAVAVFFVWSMGLDQSNLLTAFIIFWVQLILNILWSFIFFGRKSLLGGFIAIVILWILILVNIIFFFRVSLVAGALLIPYIIWVTIASNLNFQVWKLNRRTPDAAKPGA